jgi:hypothetical protein
VEAYVELARARLAEEPHLSTLLWVKRWGTRDIGNMIDATGADKWKYRKLTEEETESSN